jgi:3-oxoacyl-[acyl-carrier protein] reductase
MNSDERGKPIALVTGVGRAIGIAKGIVEGLKSDGWNVATAGWDVYDDRMPWGSDESVMADYQTNLEDPGAASSLVDKVREDLGPIRALVLAHSESVDSDIRNTTVESFDRHMAVNARASWLLIRQFASQFSDPKGTGRIVGLTSDHTSWNLAYGASKGAMDRIVLAAAVELADLGITANVVNPGPTDTGWITTDLQASLLRGNLQPRLGQPEDCANLVRFLCSGRGQWINGQLLYSNGGRRQ